MAVERHWLDWRRLGLGSAYRPLGRERTTTAAH